MKTSWTNKIEILRDVSLNFMKPEWSTYIAENYLGVAIANLLVYGQIDNIDEDMEQEVNEAFEALLSGYGILEDTGFDSLKTIVAVSE